MTRLEFIYALREELKGMPLEDVERHVDYYSEMIDDRMEEGMTEEEAVADVGDPRNIAAQILSDTPIKKIVKDKISKKREMSAAEMLLIIFTSPIWVPLLISLFSTLISIIVSIFSVIIVLYAVAVGLMGAGVGLAIGAVVQYCTAKIALGTLMLGSAFICASIGILLFMACNALSKLVVLGIKKLVLAIKRLIIGRRPA